MPETGTVIPKVFAKDRDSDPTRGGKTDLVTPGYESNPLLKAEQENVPDGVVKTEPNLRFKLTRMLGDPRTTLSSLLNRLAGRGTVGKEERAMDVRNPDPTIASIVGSKDSKITPKDIQDALAGSEGTMRGQQLLIELMKAEAANNTTVAKRIRELAPDLVARHDKLVTSMSDPRGSGHPDRILGQVQQAMAAADAERATLRDKLGMNVDPMARIDDEQHKPTYDAKTLKKFNDASKPKGVEASYLVAVAQKAIDNQNAYAPTWNEQIVGWNADLVSKRPDLHQGGKGLYQPRGIIPQLVVGPRDTDGNRTVAYESTKPK